MGRRRCILGRCIRRLRTVSRTMWSCLLPLRVQASKRSLSSRLMRRTSSSKLTTKMLLRWGDRISIIWTPQRYLRRHNHLPLSTRHRTISPWRTITHNPSHPLPPPNPQTPTIQLPGKKPRCPKAASPASSACWPSSRESYWRSVSGEGGEGVGQRRSIIGSPQTMSFWGGMRPCVAWCSTMRMIGMEMKTGIGRTRGRDDPSLGVEIDFVCMASICSRTFNLDSRYEIRAVKTCCVCKCPRLMGKAKQKAFHIFWLTERTDSWSDISTKTKHQSSIRPPPSGPRERQPRFST